MWINFDGVQLNQSHEIMRLTNENSKLVEKFSNIYELLTSVSIWECSIGNDQAIEMNMYHISVYTVHRFSELN